jgi:hypothetical protein
VTQGYLRSTQGISGPDGDNFEVGVIKIAVSRGTDLTIDIFDVNGKVRYSIPTYRIQEGGSLSLTMPVFEQKAT